MRISHIMEGHKSLLREMSEVGISVFYSWVGSPKNPGFRDRRLWWNPLLGCHSLILELRCMGAEKKSELRIEGCQIMQKSGVVKIKRNFHTAPPPDL